jgi:hypothetical protein
MSPKIIDDTGFKFCEKLSTETIKKLVIDGGSENVKESLVNVWNYGHEENVALPILVTRPDGKVTGTKWGVTGMVEPKAVKAE